MSVAALILAAQALKARNSVETESFQKLIDQLSALADKPGRDGRDGSPGRDGVGVERATVREGRLILTRTTGDDIDVGPVTGPIGPKGGKGDPGESIIGPPGPAGRDGRDGEDGVGIANVERVKDNIVVTLDDGRTVDLGNFRGPQGPSGPRGPAGTGGSGGGIASGPITASGLTMNADRILGRTTSGTGAVEELAAGIGLRLTAGTVTTQLRGASVTRNTAGSALYPNGIDTPVPWQLTDYDTDSLWSAGTPDRLTIPAGLNGRYVVAYALCRFSLNFVGTRDYFYIGWYNSGGTLIRGFAGNQLNLATNVTLPTNSAPLLVSTGDYFQIRVNQSSGSAIQHDTLQVPNNYLAIQVVG